MTIYGKGKSARNPPTNLVLMQISCRFFQEMIQDSQINDVTERSSDRLVPAVKLLSKRHAGELSLCLIMIKRQEEADRTIYVGNLDCNVREEILYELFLQAGPLTKVTIAKDKEGNLKSFGFVCYKHTESVPYAISLLNGIRLFGRPIKLQYRFGRFLGLSVVFS
ncbi:hypothetical protein GDO81_006916 [Engystomops pustulosus]|uniref:Splicing regulator RBM11 n=1 Tax=Engystomops pustulosus TaxID=76066 RepID=A0AAV7D3G7_ENGPU|nr:hypothetical protein GDO81_006916 [Engystomops pustulosus]